MITKIMLLLFILLNVSLGIADSPSTNRPKIVLLTSLNLTSMKPVFFQESYRNYHLKIEEQFREHFRGRNYRLDVRHFVRQNDLWDAIQSKDNTAVILVAHAGSGSEQITGFQRAALIDLYGYDMTPILRGLHSDLKFLGVIGCDYKKNLDLLVKTQLQNPNPHLSTSFFDKKIAPDEGLEKTLASLDKALRKQNEQTLPDLQTPPAETKISIHVKRFIPTNENEIYHPPVRIENSQGQVLGVLPRAFAGESQSLNIEVSERPRKLIITAGNNPFVLRDNVRLGQFQFESPAMPGQWSIFADGLGQALGTVSNIYRYTENN